MGPGCSLERVTGIEPALSAWKAGVLPLNYTRINALKARWSGRQDSNLRHPAPKAGALPNCATSRLFSSCSIPNYPPRTSIFFSSSRIAVLRSAIAPQKGIPPAHRAAKPEPEHPPRLKRTRCHRTPRSRTAANAPSWQQVQLRFVDNADSPLPHQRGGNAPSRNQSAGEAPVVHLPASAGRALRLHHRELAARGTGCIGTAPRALCEGLLHVATIGIDHAQHRRRRIDLARRMGHGHPACNFRAYGQKLEALGEGDHPRMGLRRPVETAWMTQKAGAHSDGLRFFGNLPHPRYSPDSESI